MWKMRYGGTGATEREEERGICDACIRMQYQDVC